MAAPPLPPGFSFSSLPDSIREQLLALEYEVLEGIYTQKGFEVRRRQILEPLLNAPSTNGNGASAQVDSVAAAATLAAAATTLAAQPPPRQTSTTTQQQQQQQQIVHPSLSRSASLQADVPARSQSQQQPPQAAAAAAPEPPKLNTPPSVSPFLVAAQDAANLHDGSENGAADMSTDMIFNLGEEVMSTGGSKRRTLVLDYNQDSKRLSTMIQNMQRAMTPPVTKSSPAMPSVSAIPTSPISEADIGVQPADAVAAADKSSPSRKRMSYFEMGRAVDNSEVGLSVPQTEDGVGSLVGQQQQPTVARELPGAGEDELSRAPLSSFATLCPMLTQRMQSLPKGSAFTLLDNKGKEVQSITWEKVRAKAEKVAVALNASERVSRGDRVALYFRKAELVDFVYSLFGVWYAGMVPLPITTGGLSVDDDISELLFTLNSSRTGLVLSTENSLRTLQRELSSRKRAWPDEIEWWRANELPSVHSSSNRPDAMPAEPVPTDVAYIDFGKTRDGKLRGVSVTHAGMMKQLCTLKGSFALTFRDVFVSTCEPRQSLGLVLSVLSAVYNGYHCINMPSSVMETPGLWLTLLTKYQATLSSVTHHCMRLFLTAALRNPESLTSYLERTPANLSAMRALFVDSPIASPTLHEDFAQALSPYRLVQPSMEFVLTPILCLPEFGGLILSYRDPLPDSQALIYENNVAEVLLDRMSLRQGQVVLIDGDPTKEVPGALRAMASGLAVPLARVAIVSADQPKTLVLPNTVGEIYFASPALQGASFFGQPKNSEATFYSRPLTVNADETLSPTPEAYLRTGYFGCLVDGNVLVVLGHRSERIKQVIPAPAEVSTLPKSVSSPQPELVMYHYAQDLAHTIKSYVPGVENCVIFTFVINNCILPVMVVEALRRVDELAAVCAQVKQVLDEIHELPCFAVALVAPDRLPRIKAHGIINSDAVQSAFEAGSLNPLWLQVDTSNMRLEPHVPAKIEASQMRQITSGVELSAETRDDTGKLDLAKYKTLSDVLTWRADKQADEVAFVTIDSKGREVKTVTWKKLSNKVSSLASILTKKGLRAGDHVIVMYSHSIEYLIAMHACIYHGFIAIPMPPPDMNRLAEDVPTLTSICDEFGVQGVLVNTVVEEILKSKAFHQQLRINKQTRLPSIHNTSKVPKSTKAMGSDGLRLDDKYIANRDIPAVLWVNFNADMERTITKLSHQKLMDQCRVVRQSCQLNSSRYLASCVRTYTGIGFLYAIAMGVYTGAPTLYLSPFDFSTNPQVWFEVMHKYKVKDTFVTYPMLQYAISATDAGDSMPFSLHNLQNLLIAQDDRPHFETYQNVMHSFEPIRLSETPAAILMSTPANAYIASRSYMNSDLVTLNVSLRALRQRRIEIVEDVASQRAAIGSTTVTLHDSGRPPAGTTIAIVDPDTRRLCSPGELGEIWVAGTMNVEGFVDSAEAGPTDTVMSASTNGTSASERFAQIPGDYRFMYARTGQYGFLHPGSPSHDPRQTGKPELVLFHLGGMSDSFKADGYLHFAMDIETTLQRLHPMIIPDGCVAMNMDGRLVVAVEVEEDTNFLNCVPLITMAIMAEHNLIVDTIAFLQEGMLARSRLFEKQRKKISAAFQANRLPTLHIHHNVPRASANHSHNQQHEQQ
ncbi:hypothetical protein RI367_006462 [Sorochytrium milnesiophthora]